MIELFGIEFDSGFDSEEVDDSFHKLNSIFLFVNVIGNIGLRVVFLCEPIQNISHQLEVGFGKVLQGNDSRVVEGAKHFAKATALPKAHASEGFKI